MKSCDLVLVSLPYTIVEVPPLGPAVLKGALESEGFNTKIFDLGMELFKHVGRDPERFEDFQFYFFNYIIKNQADKEAEAFFNLWANKILELKPTWVGISLFSSFSQLSTYILTSKLKILAPDIKIVVGGQGAAVTTIDPITDACQLTTGEKMLRFGDFLKKRKLITECIYGDGEQALVDLLKGTTPIEEFYTEDYKNLQHPFANFDDYNLYDYEGQLNKGFPQIPIFSSKGCVRNCDFCDVNTIQNNKFRFRTGKNIAEEMIFLAEKYQIKDFVFLDSLANGNLKSLKEWLTMIGDYNSRNPDKKLTWAASGWICRPQGQMPKSMYKLMQDSGCASVSIGAETGSNHVLKQMNKKTTVEALHYDTEQLYSHGINFITLMMVGHWAETWEDFLQTCDMMLYLSRYARYGNYIGCNTGLTFSARNDTPSYNQFEKNKMIINPINEKMWWTSLNPELTFKERHFRLFLLEKLLHTLNIPMMYPIGTTIYNEVEKSIDHIEKFYTEVTKDANLSKQCAEHYYYNFDEFISLVVDRNRNLPRKTNLSLNVDVSSTNESDPILEIEFNGEILYSESLPEGIHTIDVKLLQQDQNSLAIRLKNKSPNDTIVDADGNIVKDKFIVINSLYLDKFNLSVDYDFFYQHFKYKENNSLTDVKSGFWMNNSELILDFDYPFLYWYSVHSRKNNKLDATIFTENPLSLASWDENNDVKCRNKAAELLSRLSH